MSKWYSNLKRQTKVWLTEGGLLNVPGEFLVVPLVVFGIVMVCVR